MVEKALLHRGIAIIQDRFDAMSLKELERFCQEYHLLILTYADIVYNDFAPYHAVGNILVANDKHHRKCDFCRADIWNTWFHCAICFVDHSSQIQGHDFCVDCVAINRGCSYSQQFTPMCHRPIIECLRDLTHFANVYNHSPRLEQLASFAKVPRYSIGE
ncbi:hypothetical protein DSO57_1015834 [Entomophthora muscae]|uniref:Uncharacterized protein n=1 Tax=Entomophthora muscae TaxID=34485 RepID=A0ACC2TFR2_9FUNG|nr:hypothetical protein DSO57_1015834 [Entomophthora muscae]